MTRRLGRWLVASAALQLVCALTLGGRLHPDEIHQWVEPAHRWAVGYGTISREWYAGMRNVLGPGLVAAVFSALRAVGVTSSSALLGALHLVTALCALRALVALHAHLARRAGEDSAELTVALLACSVPVANLLFRPMGESLSLMAVLMALACFDAAPFRLGLWLGAAFVLRYPSGLLLIAPAAALALRRDRTAFLRATAGVAVPVAALGLSDALFWGDAFHSVVAYLRYNLVDDRARIDFGARPAWFYLACLPLLVPAGAWVALPSLDRRRLGLAGATAAVYLAGMSAIAHKEFRFALVAVPLVTAALVAAKPSWSLGERRRALALTAAQSVVALAALYVSGYCQGDVARASRWAGARADLRELVVVNATHPGLSVIGRDVPVWGDRREQRARTATEVAARGLGWCPPGRYLVCDERRGPCVDDATRRDGCAVVARFGRAVVLSASR